MPAGFKAKIIFFGILFLIKPLICHRMSVNSEHRRPSGFNAPSEDEISYALNELSLDDLKALSQVMDAFSENEIQMIESNNPGHDFLEEQARFKRENPQATPDDGENLQPLDVDEEYIKQLDESFPNVDDLSNSDDKEKAHVRVKRT